MGKDIYSAESGNRLREGKSLLHEMRNLLRHTCYAQILISQPLSSSSALRVHSFPTLEKNSETFVLLMYAYCTNCFHRQRLLLVAAVVVSARTVRLSCMGLCWLPFAAASDLACLASTGKARARSSSVLLQPSSCPDTALHDTACCAM